MLGAYLRERVLVPRLLPLVVGVGLLGGPAGGPVRGPLRRPLQSGRLIEVGLAGLAIVGLRIRDDLADRRGDALEQPQRVLVRAARTGPVAALGWACTGLASLGLALRRGPARGLGLLGLAGALELGYRLELPGRGRWVLLKYPLLVALLADDGLPPAHRRRRMGLAYLGVAAFERIDDPRLSAGPRARVYLAAEFVALAGLLAVELAALARPRPASIRITRRPELERDASVGPLAQALWLALPVTLAGLTHVLVIRRGLLPGLAALPLDAGLRVRGRRLFGAHKTVRGVVVMLGAALVWTGLVDALARGLDLDPSLRYLDREQLGSIGLGLLLGAAYLAGELPNSFIKRQLDVEPGQPGRGWARPLAWMADQLDGPLAILLALARLRRPTREFALALVLVAGLVHPAVAALMFTLGLKDRIG